MKIEKTFENEGGNILVRFCPKSHLGRCGIVEMLHLYNENKSGCVICAWEVRKIDDRDFPEIKVVRNRLTTTSFSFDILEALKFGQKLAEDSVYYKFENIFEEASTEIDWRDIPEDEKKKLILKYLNF